MNLTQVIGRTAAKRFTCFFIIQTALKLKRQEVSMSKKMKLRVRVYAKNVKQEPVNGL